MKTNPIDEDIFNIGICCHSHQAATCGSLREMEHDKEGRNAISSKPRRATLAGRMPSPASLLCGEGRRILPRPHDNSHAERASPARATQSERELLAMPSLLDRSGDDDRCQCSDGCTATTCSESSRSITAAMIPPEDAFALEVGLNAHEYLEECFYSEASVLSREKFDAIPEVTKSDLTIKGHLGRGSFSDVFEVVLIGGSHAGGQLFDAGTSNTVEGGTQLDPRRSTRHPPRTDRRLVFAMKCLRPQIRASADQFTIGAEDLVHETAILSNLDHPHVIKLHGRAAGHLMNAFLSNCGYFILIDRLEETLHDKIRAWKQAGGVLRGPTPEGLEVARSVADAMAYLHSKNIVFRDLKPDNVGFDHNGVLKLFDFGFATGLPERDENNPAGFLYDRCGTPRYMAPEVGLSLGYKTKADVYSFGVLLWELCSLTKPFSSIKTSHDFQRTVFMGGNRPAIADFWPAAVKELIRSCWYATPSRRPSMLDIKSSVSLAICNPQQGSSEGFPI